MKKIWVSGSVLVLLCTCTTLAQEDSFFDSDGVRIHYIVEGHGEPVVLIHGFAGDLTINWGAPGIIKGLADRYQVIAIDNRGHGRSDKPHDPQKYGQNMASDVLRLLDHLNIRKAHIVGYSMGGRIATAFLVDHPERVRSAVLGGTPWAGADGLAARTAWEKNFAESLESGKGFGPLLVRLTPRDDPPPTAERIEGINKILLQRNDALALAAVMRASAGLYVSEKQLRANRVPVLAIVGEKDPVKAETDKLVAALSNVKLVVVPGANHMTAFSRPEFLSAVQTFLAAHGEQ